MFISLTIQILLKDVTLADFLGNVMQEKIIYKPFSFPPTKQLYISPPPGIIAGAISALQFFCHLSATRQFSACLLFWPTKTKTINCTWLLCLSLVQVIISSSLADAIWVHFTLRPSPLIYVNTGISNITFYFMRPLLGGFSLLHLVWLPNLIRIHNSVAMAPHTLLLRLERNNKIYLSIDTKLQSGFKSLNILNTIVRFPESLNLDWAKINYT